MEHLNLDTNSEIKTKINEIRKDLVNLITPVDNKFKTKTRKRLDEIEKMTRINREQKTRLLQELSEIDLDLQYKRKCLDFTNDDNNYIGLKNLEYTFADLDDYYKPILAKQSFNGNYPLYTCRGDKNRDMSIDTYLDKVIPYIRILISEKKVTEQKIQLDIGINLMHITAPNNRITFYVKTDNITCLPYDNTDGILDLLLASFYDKYHDKLLLCRTSSSYAYESAERLSIHFHKIDLKRGSSYIPSPTWCKKEKCSNKSTKY